MCFMRHLGGVQAGSDARVRRAVQVDGMSIRHAAQEFGLEVKMLKQDATTLDRGCDAELEAALEEGRPGSRGACPVHCRVGCRV